jgi:antitoxin component YwqK of YwqJK toxin-antitoxin module
MKNCKTCTILVVFFLMINSYSQKINLHELHVMSGNKNWEFSNKYLLSKGWDYNDSQKGDDEHYNTISWGYNKTGYDKEKALGWIYIFTYDGLPNKVVYRFREKSYYSDIREQLKSFGYKFQSEQILDNKVIAVYGNTTYSLEISYVREIEEDSYSDSGSYTVYEITVFKKGGVYDPDNGMKKDFDENGNLKVEYSMKDGQANGPIKYFNPDGNVLRTSYMIKGSETGFSTTYYYDNDTGDVKAKYSGEVVNDKKEGAWSLKILKNDKELTMSQTTYVNDIEEGSFREVTSDTIIYGQYSKGLLDGKYQIFKDVSNAYVNRIEADTVNLKKVVTGFFLENKRIGLWKFYDPEGTLTKEGRYLDSLQVGTWKYYYKKAKDQDNNIEEYSGKLFLEENYKRGKLSGNVIRYSYLDMIENPCTDDNKKICYESRFVKISQHATYEDDELNGPYELKDKNDVLLAQGTYVYGKKESKWRERNYSDVIRWKGETTETGNYINDKKEGKWERYDDDNRLIESYFYNSDQLNGEHTLFDSNRPSERRDFNSGLLVGLKVLDNAENIITMYQLSDFTDTKYNCTKTERNTSGIFIRTYRVDKNGQKNIDPFMFRTDFETLPPSSKILDGYYECKTLDERPLEKGQYINDHKAGTWITYHYDQKVKTEFEYDVYGKVQKEYYYDIRKEEPFSGEFLYKDNNSDITEERKIKDGLRHGTTRYRDTNDKTIKKETYKDGILKA